MLGLIVSSTASGFLVSRTGKYKVMLIGVHDACSRSACS